MKNIASIGIDVSKDKLDIALLDQDQKTQLIQFQNNKDDIEDLTVFLKDKGAQSAPLVLESTGEYHLLTSLMLHTAGFRVKCINPLITKQYERASIRGAKTDKLDSLRLAKIGILETNLSTFSDTTKELKAKKYVSILASLEGLRQSLGQSLSSIERNQSILHMKTKHKSISKILLCLQKEIKSLKLDLTKLLPASWAKYADQTKGISRAQLAVLHILLLNHHFSHKDKLVAFVGLDVRKRQSGAWVGREHISKRGNPYARKVLYQIAWGLVMHNPKYKQYYQSLRNRNKHYLTAMTAVSRKFLRCFYAQILKAEQTI